MLQVDRERQAMARARAEYEEAVEWATRVLPDLNPHLCARYAVPLRTRGQDSSAAHVRRIVESRHQEETWK